MAQAHTPFSGCARLGSRPKSIRNSNSDAMTSSMPSAHVLHEVSSSLYNVAKCLSRVRRLSSHGSFRLKKSQQDSVSSTSNNTFSILNELRWALDPAAVFPVESIAKVTETSWSDPHANPTLELVGFEETLKRRALLQTVTKRIVNCRAVIVTLGLAEVWRDIKADVYLNNTPIPPLLVREPDRYELHLTSFAQNWANLEAIHALLSRYGHPDLRIVVTVSPVPLHATFLKMDVVLATTYAKSLLRAAAQQWAIAHENVDYFPSYEIVQNSDRAAVWQPDRIHVTVAALHHVIGLFLQSYLEEDSLERSFSRGNSQRVDIDLPQSASLI